MKRRRFLGMMGASVAAGVSGCSDDDGGGSSQIPVAPAKAKDIPVGSIGTTGTRILIGRDAGGLYAMTASCTHQLCDLGVYGELSSPGISCKCHGSGFSLTGERLRGPAVDSLKHFKVDVAADGTYVIDAMTVVDAAVRTPVA